MLFRSVWLLGRRGARLQRIGWALTLGALPVLLTAGGLWTLLLLLGGSGGSLVGEFASITRLLAALPALDALLTMVAGLALVFAPRGVR